MKHFFFNILFIFCLFSCSNEKKQNTDIVENDTDFFEIISVSQGDSLPSEYKKKPVSAPLKKIKIVKNPMDSLAPNIISDRLSIVFEDLDTDLNAFTKEFKRLYPKDDYKIIGYNDELKTIEISIPEDVRDLMVNGLNAQMPGFKFLIMVESVYKQESFEDNKCSKAGWHIDAINLREAWKETKGSSNVIVAVLDGGFDIQHEMFQGRMCNPYNIVTHDGNVLYEDQNDIHGTHVAALAIGSDMHESEGITGVAPNCLFMPIKVFQNGMCTDKMIFEAICYASNHNADVINVSVGLNIDGLDFDKLSLEFQREYAKSALKPAEMLYNMAFSRAKQKNAIVVLAAGNDNVITTVAPKNRTGKAIVVCASDIKNNATKFTNFGDGSTVTAPGEAIISAIPNNEYGCLDGTSMAAPIVTGLVALMKSKNPDITLEQVVYRLQNTGSKISGNVPVLIQADKAILNQTKKIATFTINGISFDMKKVEGGTFLMGGTDEQGSEFENERPIHKVTLSDYYVGTTEVTQALWGAVMGENPSHFKNACNPVESVSWDDCQKFIEKLNLITGKDFRLLTEAEWEFAARGGIHSLNYRYAGNSDISKIAWYGDKYDTGNPHPVAQKTPNELGIYDMSGNVWEWCSDSYKEYSTKEQIDPKFPSYNGYRIMRGGAYSTKSVGCRVSYRCYYHDKYPNKYLGLRLALSSIESPKAFSKDTESICVNGVTIKMNKVKGGIYVNNYSESSTLSDYYIGATEVTQALWKAVMGEDLMSLARRHKYKTYGVGPNYPMYYISWDEVQLFLSKLNSKTGKKFRLPTEIEWEFAAKGGTKSKNYKYAGSNGLDSIAWCNEDKKTGSTHPVAKKKPNELGLYDMDGNVSEWCSYVYTKDFENLPERQYTDHFVLIGGNWIEMHGKSISYINFGPNPSGSNNIGFRLAITE